MVTLSEEGCALDLVGLEKMLDRARTGHMRENSTNVDKEIRELGAIEVPEVESVTH